MVSKIKLPRRCKIWLGDAHNSIPSLRSPIWYLGTWKHNAIKLEHTIDNAATIRVVQEALYHRLTSTWYHCWHCMGKWSWAQLVLSDNRGSWFESSHRQTHILSTEMKRRIKEKICPFFKKLTTYSLLRINEIQYSLLCALIPLSRLNSAVRT